MVASIAAGTSANYYLSCADYYLGGREPEGHWIAVGIEAGLNQNALVERAPFERLHAALRDDGSSLLAKRGRTRRDVGGYDVSLSVPKSVSIIWAFSDVERRREIEEAQANAVAAAIAFLEENAAYTRSGKDGIYRHRTRLTVAAFQHGEARPAKHEDGTVFADMGLHTHAVILNIGRKSGSRVPKSNLDADIHGALDGHALFSWSKTAGSVYHAEFAKGLQKLGLAIDEIGKNGIFEITGVAPELRRYFSARRTEIEDELEIAGTESRAAPALAAAITKATRKSKQEFSCDRFVFWRERAEALGFDRAAMIDACLNAGREQSSALGDTDRERLTQQRLALIPGELTEHESHFELRKLYAAVASALVGTGHGAERVEVEVKRLVASKALIALDHDVYGHAIFSTPEMMTIEREIGEIASCLSSRAMASAPDKRCVERLIRENNLNAEQAEAVRAATSAEMMTIGEGAPGSGKTTLLKPVVQAWREAGYRVIGCATAWKVGTYAARRSRHRRARGRFLACDRQERWALSR